MVDGQNRNRNRLNDLIRCCEGKCNLFGRTEKNWAPQLGSTDQSDKMNDEEEDADDVDDDEEGK